MYGGAENGRSCLESDGRAAAGYQGQARKTAVSVRGGSGLGDAIYLQSVARELLARGFDQVEVCSDWPDVFLPLGERVKVSPFRRLNVDRLAHYSRRRFEGETTQFEDCCIEAGLGHSVPLRLDWGKCFSPPQWAAEIEKPIICVLLPRAPFARKDGYGMELLPDCSRIQQAIDRLKGRAYLVQLGSGPALYKFEGIDLDLSGKTSVRELLDIASIADGFLGYCSFFIPLAESLGKKALIVWSRRALRSSDRLIRSITPQKIFTRDSTCRFVIDDCSRDEIGRSVDALCYA